jgi:hypothetical protein
MQNCVPMPRSTLLKQTAIGSSSFSTLAGSARPMLLLNEEFADRFSGDGDRSMANVGFLASVWPGHLYPVRCSQNLEKTFSWDLSWYGANFSANSSRISN